MIPLTERHDPVATPVIRVEVSPDPMGVAWELLEACTDHDGVADVLEHHGGELPHGALVRVLEHGRTASLHVANIARAELVLVPDGPRLVAQWEGNDAPEMLNACESVDRRRVVLTACDIAETVLHLVPAGVESPRRAVEAAREWVRGRATADEVLAAAYAAVAAYSAASGVGAARAARAAAWAAFAAASYAAAAASYAAAADAADAAASYAAAAASYAAADAADAAAADAARAVWSADAAARAAGDCATYAAIVRRHIPLAVVACARVGARDPLPLTPR